jgi:hypothetical protein
MISLAAGTIQAGVNPSLLMIKVLEVRFSPNSDCSQSVTTYRNPAAQYQDFATNPALGSGALPQGTYHCIAIHLSDLMTARPAANDGIHCLTTTSFTQDIFNDPALDNSYTPEGTHIVGHGTPTPDDPGMIEDDPWVYFSDSSDASASNGCFQPTLTGTGGPCVLSTPIVMQGDQSHSLVVNFDGVINDNGSHCSLGPPVMTFR